MFTLKFFLFPDITKENEFTETVISCPHYTKSSSDDGCTIIVHKDFFSTDGVEYHVNTREDSYHSCFIENNAGKTIDTIRVRSLDS